MRHSSAIVTVVLVVLYAAGCAQRAPAPAPQSLPSPEEVTAMTFSLTSSAFKDGDRIPAKYTADGADVSPPLSWDKLPEGTVSLAVICDDPDAPAGTWTHWVLYDLPADRAELPEGVPSRETVPELGGAKHGLNDFGIAGYGGPSPPRGPAHHYHFRLYALDAKLDLPARARKGDVDKATQGHILGQAQLVGLYGR